MKNTLFSIGKQLGLTAFLLTALVASVYAETKAACVFVSLENNAWIINKDSQVKTSLKIGDVLKEGDRVVVNHGNRVQLAFDKDCKNVVQIEGDASFTLNSTRPANIQLQTGKVFALLDNLPKNSGFAVETPTAIGAVRGTQYQVNIEGAQTNFLVYRGHVEVANKEKDGTPNYQTVMLGAGEKTSVEGLGIAPLPAQQMTRDEKDEIIDVAGGVQKTRESIEPQQMDSWLNPPSPVNGEAGSIVKAQAKKSKEGESKSKNGGIVF